MQTMPTLEGRSLELYKSIDEAEYTRYTELVQERARVAVAPQAEHKHQLFHDAESTFWVTAWTLARSAPKDYKEEKTWPPVLNRFVMAMETHEPGPDAVDSRDTVVIGLDGWTGVLHPSLVSVAGMLDQMHDYISPEWQYRPELDVEHVHEALMRLLLTEIVRIEDSGADVGLVIGGRVLPISGGSKGNVHSSSVYQLIAKSSGTHLQAPRNDAPDTNPQAPTDPTQDSPQLTNAGEPQPRRSLKPQHALAPAPLDQSPDLITKVKQYPSKTDYHLEMPGAKTKVN
ncbi:hypothetical protein FRC06_007173 [Ceratobasidium sp. 370]|nr:hypothetical protein FRC06_007173 [Ceratobasidium sp. 370]